MKQTTELNQSYRETIRGMVVPANWNDRFQVTGVLVACHDEREVKVENLESFPNLQALAQQEAVFTGLVRKQDGMEFIFLEDFTLVSRESE
ncbi:hypothetical protein [Pseudodesulfovibrio sp. zrk46]|uniref:hypothetical protein n=1 Tax=Pseudodesulfovibrio sp. zrk46 TaxID=2725288 RepID=UPI0014491EBD|nr:hypothetical protein [Pseudodesulfovibrio sp. zrk46]QJB56816.1 hypothetical protein HFN16_10540 [Pseudodesulfovibrio sp. zrk46]